MGCSTNTRDKWSLVPLENFSNHSEIDWTKSVEEIDKQLYQKYKLDESDIEFIEKKVQKME